MKAMSRGKGGWGVKGVRDESQNVREWKRGDIFLKGVKEHCCIFRLNFNLCLLSLYLFLPLILPPLISSSIRPPHLPMLLPSNLVDTALSPY